MSVLGRFERKGVWIPAAVLGGAVFACLIFYPRLFPMPPLYAPFHPSAPAPLTKKATTTLFWIGERADASNDYIPNGSSAWDERWLEHYGGADSPENRCGFKPCAFTPRENPFYAALPYNDLADSGKPKSTRSLVPWQEYASGSVSMLKNRWIEISYGERICYAQWEDVGPSGEDDFDYVFGGSETPKNTFGERAGLDLSPAVWTCLGMTDNAVTEWRFVDAADVPDGPWKKTVTTRDATW